MTEVKTISPIHRVCWPAIFSGVVVVLATQLVFTILGLAFGAGTFDPLTEKNPAAGLGMGTTLWFVVTAILSLFVGGWVSGRMATSGDRLETALHGVVTWGLATILSTFLITTTVGKIVSGSAHVFGKVLSLTGDGIKAVAPDAAKLAADNLGIDSAQFDRLASEARKTLLQTRKPELSPNQLTKTAKQVGRDAQDSAVNAAERPQEADAEFNGLLRKIFARTEATLDAADRTAVVNVVMARTGQSREDAEKSVAQWEQTLAQAKQQLKEASAKAEQKAREAGDAAARSVSKAAFFLFVSLLMGAAAAAAGGIVGATPRYARTTESTPAYT